MPARVTLALSEFDSVNRHRPGFEVLSDITPTPVHFRKVYSIRPDFFDRVYRPILHSEASLNFLRRQRHWHCWLEPQKLDGVYSIQSFHVVTASSSVYLAHFVRQEGDAVFFARTLVLYDLY